MNPGIHIDVSLSSINHVVFKMSDAACSCDVETEFLIFIILFRRNLCFKGLGDETARAQNYTV
jgi:hypothetical protein